MKKLTKIACLLLIASLPLACGTPQVNAPDPSQSSENALPLVFVPGLNGSLLFDESGSNRWVRLHHSLGFSTPDLSLPLSWTASGEQTRDGLRPDGVIMDVSLISGVLGLDFYGPWVHFAGELAERPLHVFAYDWRRANIETSAKLEEFLLAVSAKYGNRPVQVVGHSMGGMLTLSVLNRRPELFDRVVFAGVPFRGGIGYLSNMHTGLQIGANGSLLSAEVLFGHPSVYSFYPSGLPFENTDVARDKDGKLTQLDFYNAETWREHGFGVFHAQSAKWRGDADNRMSFLTRALSEGRKFREAMQPRRKADAYPPVLVVASNSRPTEAYIQPVAPSVKTGDRWAVPKAGTLPGDGSVLYRDMLPPEPIAHDVALSDYSHPALLNDPQIQRKVAQFLQKTD